MLVLANFDELKFQAVSYISSCQMLIDKALSKALSKKKKKKKKKKNKKKKTISNGHWFEVTIIRMVAENVIH